MDKNYLKYFLLLKKTLNIIEVYFNKINSSEIMIRIKPLIRVKFVAFHLNRIV